LTTASGRLAAAIAGATMISRSPVALSTTSAAPLEHQRLSRCARRGRADRRPDPRALAQGQHPGAGRFGVCPRRAHGVVRGERRRLRLRSRTQ
jgi:hypothetical protein